MEMREHIIFVRNLGIDAYELNASDVEPDRKLKRASSCH